LSCCRLAYAKTYPGFGVGPLQIAHALGWLLVGLRGIIPDWASVFVPRMLFLAPVLLYEGIRQFRGNPTIPGSTMR